MSYQRDRENFILVCAKNNVPADVARLVMRHANTCQRIAAVFCSVELSDRETKRLEKQDASCSRRISEVLAPYNVTADFQGDPRGSVVKVCFPGGQRNDWGGDNLYCVPTREY